MHSQIDNWLERIDEITASFRASFGPLSERQLNWKPSAQIWSVAENMEHLIVVNESYYQILDDARENRLHLPFLARFNFITKMLGGFILKSVQPDRRKKVKTFPIWEPARSKITEGIMELFNEHQEKLKNIIKQNRDLIEKDIIIYSPANKHIVYPLSTAIEIMVTHEMRHYNQAREAMAMQAKQLQF
ncbi:DinB family protein [Pollutibacter soli]|uniref:DinB family protein n=1 Tax=Pollutibacter soli TaxID=3034157 RepID=UPI00301369A5